MPDKSAENLARIRACDADWNESDHPRADNGQFTSGSGGGGAKVSKLQAGGKAKAQTLRNVSGALAGVNAELDKINKRYAANLKSNLARESKIRADIERREADLEEKHKNDWRYGNAYGRLQNKPGLESLAERVKQKGKALERSKREEENKLDAERRAASEEYGLDGRRREAAAIKADNEKLKPWLKKQALEAEQKKFQGAKKTLEKARPGIRQMRADKLGYEKLTSEKASNYPEGEAHNLMVGALKSAGGDFKKAQASLLESFGDNPKLAAAIKRLKPPAQAAAPSVSPEQSAAKFTKIAETFKKIDPQVAKYAKQAAKIAAKSGEAAALEWAKNKSAEIEADPELFPVAKGFHQGRLRMLTEQYNRPAESSAPNRAAAPAPTPQPSKKSDVGQKGIDYLRSISHVNSSFEENTGYTARNMLDMINEGKTLKEIRSEMRANIKKHSPDIDGDLQHLDSIIARVKRAQQ